MLPSDILLHIINKLTIKGIQHLTIFADMDDIQYRYLYSVDFKFVYGEYSQIFDLDTSITWKDHYIQMFRLHNLVKCHKESTHMNDHKTLSAFYNNIFLDKIKFSGTVYLVDKSILSIWDIPAHVEYVLYTRFSIPDYYIISLKKLIHNNKLCLLKPSIRNLLFHIWRYSKIHFNIILDQMDFVIYSAWITKTISSKVYSVDIYQYLTDEHEQGPEKLRSHDIKFIVSNNDRDILYSKYKMSGLYFKYLLERYPKCIEHHIRSMILTDK